MKTIAITHMDWALLRKQMLWLLRKKSKHAQGLICMMAKLTNMVTVVPVRGNVLPATTSPP